MHAVCEAFWMSWLSLYYWVIWIAKSLETAAGRAGPTQHGALAMHSDLVW